MEGNTPVSGGDADGSGGRKHGQGEKKERCAFKNVRNTHDSAWVKVYVFTNV